VNILIRTFDYEKLPIVEIVNEIVLDAVRRGASDIHFDPLNDYMKVRIRVDGELQDYTTVPNTLKKNLITRIKIISGMNITEVRLPQDGSIQTVLKDINLDLRVSSLPCSDGEKIVIRILDYSMSLKGLEHLGFSDSNYRKMLEMISRPSGIILVTGATGSGKSTTVYSILQKLNRETTNVITVEDPVEMDLEGVNQVQVNSDIGLTFANVLRSVLRQDPNIIMIGEIRDNETARIAVRASITGHLVLSTIHTNNSLNTIERLLDMEVERYLLASALEGIVSQKLARRLCEKCRRLRPTNQYERNLFKKVLDVDVNELYAAEGCDQCNNGYKGRIALHEVLLINQTIRDALAEGVPKEKLRELVYKSDVTTLLQDGLGKVINGNTTCEEVLKLIELDDDLEGKTQEYRYSLNKALEESNFSKLSTAHKTGGNNGITLTTGEEDKKEETPNVQ
jgi:type IV pilus assembly protein PilB